jgi:hypothetical protein
MLALLALGGAVAILREPGLVTDLSAVGWSVRWPRVELPEFTWGDLVTGILVLGLPQAALTFGNAVVSTADENNRLFPDRPVTVKRLAVGHGVMNLVGGGLGGVPMCFGAGGMAGHVRFGARTGGATVVLGLLLLGLGLFLSDSLATLLRLFPVSILGVVLLFGGLELAVGAGTSEHAPDGEPLRSAQRYVMVLTAGVAMWNMRRLSRRTCRRVRDRPELGEALRRQARARVRGQDDEDDRRTTWARRRRLRGASFAGTMIITAP